MTRSSFSRWHNRFAGDTARLSEGDASTIGAKVCMVIAKSYSEHELAKMMDKGTSGADSMAKKTRHIWRIGKNLQEKGAVQQAQNLLNITQPQNPGMSATKLAGTGITGGYTTRQQRRRR
jgi:hypothetical protein